MFIVSIKSIKYCSTQIFLLVNHISKTPRGHNSLIYFPIIYDIAYKSLPLNKQMSHTSTTRNFKNVLSPIIKYKKYQGVNQLPSSVSEAL